ncbi:MAG: pirin family protein [Candidatus Thermoplasmatota archaeon]|nr:pirin family protein [Candidatus Thermoplasmatota archaeon]
MSRLVKVIEPSTVEEGIGAVARRLFPGEGIGHLDPFVLFDEYMIEPGARFPMHPHTGFEGIQYLIEGSTYYRDSLGNEGTIVAGGARRFLTGLGFEHLEEPRSEAMTRGYLLWINLPRANKGMAPNYQQASPERIERSFKDGVMISTVLGEGTALPSITPVRMQHLTMTKGSGFEISIEEGFNSFVYLSDGHLDLSGLDVEGGKGVILADNADYTLEAIDGSEAVFVSGRRINERIIQRGHNVL